MRLSRRNSPGRGSVGAVATLATVAPLFLGTEPLPSVFYWVCMLMGLGILIAAAGVIRSATAQRRQVAVPSPPSALSVT
ncbi:hypothetical protein ACWHA1_32465 [Streptomyces decoyicus]